MRSRTLVVALAALAALALGAPASSGADADRSPATVGRVPAAVSPPDHVLVDLAPGAFYVTAVRWLHGAGHTTGVQPGWFGPDRTITRAELFTLLWRVAGEPVAPVSSFPDVPRGAYFARAVDWAVEEGLTTGVGQTGAFQPGALVDRAQLVTMLWRANGSLPAPPAPLTDVVRPSFYAAAVDWAHANGLTTGVGGTSQFRPHDLLTRGQAATFIWRDQGEPAPVAPVLAPYASSGRPATPADLPYSWSADRNCPVPPEQLAILTVRHIGFDGRSTTGEIVVHAWHALQVDDTFRHMYDQRFPIERVARVDVVGGSDDAAMAANLTTAFNCRAVTGGSGWSEHAYGRAIDINPLQNPYISRTGQVLPPGGAAYLDRGAFRVGLITPSSPPVEAFEHLGWTWGGRWSSPKDYQHFSANGR